ncbi:SseB family protein [Streptomyces winkii]|uniref:SseB family protein n=1 Tax=Streptomyces winkii TaxID=3051178 RepID=UPI0028D15764|nr:SseB family protein [Streptomyces sp. DSM 40971]
MALKDIPDPGFAADTGSADPALAEALRAWQAAPGEPGAERRVLAALAEARLLVPVVAVLGETETDESGLRREKSSEMAVPTLTSPGGRRALPAFTSTEALARWDAEARPVAVPLSRALQAVAHEEADTLVLDLAGPVTFQLTGAALRALAEGHAGADPAADPRVTGALRTLLAADPAVTGAHLVPGGAGTDATLAITLTANAAADHDEAAAAVRRLAGALASDEVLRSRLVKGLELALLPPGSPLPEGALYRA